MTLKALAAATVLVLAAAAPASAAVHIIIVQVGDDVIESAAGSLDLSSLNGPGTAATQSYTNPIVANIIMGPDTNLTLDPADHAQIYAGAGRTAIVGPTSFGTGVRSFLPSAVSGDTFGTIFASGFGRYVIVPHDYVDGTQISSGAVFANQTFATLGLTEGTYVFSWPTDLISIQIGGVGAPAPEPATWAMMIVGLGLAGTMLRRRGLPSAA